MNADQGEKTDRSGAAMNVGRANVLDRILAGICGLCPLCGRARRRAGGIAYRLVAKVEVRFCPFCRAYERVNGRPAHAGPGRDR